ncbi:unnamed protein product [Leuciscus chuanchicus]
MMMVPKMPQLATPGSWSIHFCGWLATDHQVEECRKKWKNLRDAYRREVNKTKEQKRSGSAAEGHKPWKYSAIMGFLNPFMEARPSSGNMLERVREPMMATEQRDTSTKAKQVSQSVLSIQEGPAFSQEGPAFSQEGPAFSQEGPAFSQEGPAFSQEAPAFSQEGPAFSPEGPAFSQADQEQAAPAFSQAHVASSQADNIMRQEGERSKKHKGAMTVFEKQLMAALHRAEASSRPQCVPSEDPD